MRKGYGVFGKAYEHMFRHDLHAPESIDHAFLRHMIRLDSNSREHLYSQVSLPDTKTHELYDFAKQFQSFDSKQTVKRVLKFTSEIASNYDADFDRMLFGGTEKQIIQRGTDWCTDITRVGAVLLQCLGIPCRIVHVVNLEKAYNGHVLGEAFYENHFGLADFTFGYLFYDKRPLSADDVLQDPELMKNYPEEYRAMFHALAINEYNPIDSSNNYAVTPPNPYYMKLIHSEHHDQWIMGEDQ